MHLSNSVASASPGEGEEEDPGPLRPLVTPRARGCVMGPRRRTGHRGSSWIAHPVPGSSARTCRSPARGDRPPWAPWASSPPAAAWRSPPGTGTPSGHWAGHPRLPDSRAGGFAAAAGGSPPRLTRAGTRRFRSTAAADHAARPAIDGQSVPVNVHCTHSNRRSNDGQSDLERLPQ